MDDGKSQPWVVVTTGQHHTILASTAAVASRNPRITVMMGVMSDGTESVIIHNAGQFPKLLSNIPKDT
jgi:hypothetical protein